MRNLPQNAIMSAALIAATIASLSAVMPALAQSEERQDFSGFKPSQPYTPPSYAPTAPTSPMMFSSTVHEGVGRAVANIMQAQANQMLSYAQARILIDEAIAREMQLRVINVETHLEKKRLREEAREAARLRRWEWEQRALARRQQRQQTVIADAYRLPASLLDPFTGKITWPESLQHAKFAELRADLDALFAQLADEGAQYDGLYRDPIVACCDTLRDLLWKSREEQDIAWEDYLECQKLIVGLKYGAKYWPGPATDATPLVASR